MRAGELRHRVTIQTQYLTDNGFGEMIPTWTDWQTVWAAIEPNAGRRYFEALQANAEATGICRIRYRAGVVPTMRLQFEGRTLLIISLVQPREKKDELHIYYKESLD